MKKQVAVVASALGLSLTGSAATAQEGNHVVGIVTRARFIRSALLEFQSALSAISGGRGSLQLDRYRVTVTTLNGHYAVRFHEVNLQPSVADFVPRASPSN
jgi:hypothetical protein